MAKSNIVICILIIFGTSCGTRSKEIPIVELSILNSVDVIQDSIFFNRIEDIEYLDGEYYYLDGKSGLVNVISEDFTFNRILSKAGPGPEEVKSSANFSLYNGSLYILDNGSSSIKQYSTVDGDFIKSYKLPTIAISTDFSVANNTFYISDFRNQKPLLKYHSQDGKNEYFGRSREWSNKSFDVERHVLVDKKGSIIVVYQSDIPTIELYSESDKLVQTLDLSYLDVFTNSMIKYKEEVLPRRNTSMVVVKDVQLDDDNLYMLITSHNDEGKVSFNKILKCSVTNSAIKPEVIYALNSSGYYLSFSLGKNRLVAYNYSTQSLEEYSLDN